MGGSWMGVGLDQGGDWGSLSSEGRGGRTSGLYQQSGTMCMVWGTGEVVVSWVREVEGGRKG